MVDKVKPLKLEDNIGGSQIDQTPTEATPSQDYLAARGLAINNLDSTLIDTDSTGTVQFTDPTIGVRKVLYDLSVDSGARTSYQEATITSNRITALITWTSAAKTQKIYEENYTFTGNVVTQVIKKQYNSAGTLIQTLTENLTYSGNTFSNLTATLT